MNYTELHKRFLTLQLRERALVALGGIVLILAIGFTQFIDPIIAQQTAIKADIKKTQLRFVELSQKVSDQRNYKPVDPNVAWQKKIDGLNQLLDAERSIMKGKMVNLISAKQMTSVLQALMAKSDDVALVGLSSLPPEVVIEGPNNSNEGKLYRHGIEMTLKGDFFAIQNYLEKAQQLQWQLYWQTLDFQVTAYPEATVNVTVYTLSAEDAFMGG